MNRRILKKKSKQCMDFLHHYSMGRAGYLNIFMAEKGENYHGLKIRCRCPKKHCECYYHPLKGTPMHGSMEGYYEPEWSEETIFSIIHEAVLWNDRPDSMSDKQWNRLQRITNAKPFTEEQILEMC